MLTLLYCQNNRDKGVYYYTVKRCQGITINFYSLHNYTCSIMYIYSVEYVPFL